MKKLWVVIGMLALVVSCSKLEPAAPAKDKVLDGPVDGLTYAQAAQHGLGDADFTGQVFTKETGLGPIFVATSCASCHAGDGKGHPFSTLTRFGQIDSTGNRFLDQGGPQLQDRALPGFQPEQIPAGATSAKFMPPGNTGLGFLELVPDADILSMSDPNDTNGDGISGTPNWNTIPPFVTPAPNALTRNGKYICRFGKKASVYDLRQQTTNAYNQDIGITSAFEPYDVYSHLEIDPETSTTTINNVVFYLQTLKAPVQRDQSNAEVMAGKQLFIGINCSGCHKPELRTGASPVAALNNKTFAPYTDLLLHDMGPGLDDGYTEGNAATSEWRTAPLWGLGLAPGSQGRQYFLLHDGRAHSIEEAIQMHGGEAGNAKNAFNALTGSERQKIITFLKSL
ncbi:di-heme oxidoredictase family protein [Flavitalea sp. BT771]|uniref:di-heme oxidoredictase family protein n=1 Tax=Flavitalea sp. BT771 TaxID=3063329 RepID=UPI0026E154AB|nr:di-heme oxidoredictase family protein [Flavitalea sp. BT771]MDO6431955.1 di-heme oxidoredictase family protein [Flavitalea sp. BT771]MDV6220864.1 di-heme oxidoredictase family protein [Flavitalea sp. BT771]